MDQVNRWKETPLMKAAAEGQNRNVIILLDAGERDCLFCIHYQVVHLLGREGGCLNSFCCPLHALSITTHPVNM